MTTAISGCAAALDIRIAEVSAEVRALDRALQLAHAHSFRAVKATEDAYLLAFRELGRLIRQRNKRTAK